MNKLKKTFMECSNPFTKRSIKGCKSLTSKPYKT